MADETQEIEQQDPPTKLSVSDFAAKIKAKYPQYKDIDDSSLVQKIVTKYPEYKDQIDFAQKKNSLPASPVSAPSSNQSGSAAPSTAFDPKTFMRQSRAAVLNQPAQDNTLAVQPQQTKIAIDSQLHKEEYQQRKKEIAKEAVINSTAQYLKNKGINAPVGSAQFNQQLAKTKSLVDKGEATVSIAPDGQAGLKRNTGFLENIKNGWDEATKSAEDANDFVNKMTNEQRVEYVNKHDIKPLDQFIGEKPTTFGSLGHFMGGAAPFLGKAAVGAGIGGLAVAAAPESMGASLAGLPTAMSFILTAPDMANQGAQQEIIRRYQILKSQNPQMSDSEAMDQAEKGALAGGIGGILTNAALMGTGLKTPVSLEAKGVLGKTLQQVVKSGVHMGAISAGITGAQELESEAEGIHTSTSDKLKDIANSFKDNATTGLLLTTLTHGIPKILQSAVKYGLKDTPPQEIRNVLQANENAGVVPPNTTEKIMSDLNGYNEALNKTVDGLSPEATASVAGLIQKKNNLIAESKTKDDSFKPIYKEKIDAIDQQIQDIQRTGKPFEHEIDDVTGKPYQQPTYDDVAQQKVQELAQKIAKGKPVSDPADLQVQQNFPKELEGELQNLVKEEKSSQAGKENPKSIIADNVKKYSNPAGSDGETATVGKPAEPVSSPVISETKPEQQFIPSKEPIAGKVEGKEVEGVSSNEEEGNFYTKERKKVSDSMTSDEALRLASTNNNDPLSKELAEKMIGSGHLKGLTAHIAKEGMNGPMLSVIGARGNHYHSGIEAVRTPSVIVHEFLHHYTEDVLSEQPENLSKGDKTFVDDIKKYYRIAKEADKEDRYGTSSVKEFVSGITTNEFGHFLKGIKIGDTNLFEKVKESVIKYIENVNKKPEEQGIPSEPTNKVENNSITEQDIREAQSEHDKAKAKLSDAERKLAEEQGKQTDLFGSGVQKGLFEPSREDSKAILDPLRQKVKETKAALDKIQNDFNNQSDTQPELFNKENSNNNQKELPSNNESSNSVGAEKEQAKQLKIEAANREKLATSLESRNRTYKLVNDIDEPTDARGIALQYFAGGNKVDSGEMANEVTGKRKTSMNRTGKTSDANGNTMFEKNGRTVDEIAHSLWDNLPEHIQDGITTQDIRNELLDVMGSHGSRFDAAKEYVENYHPDYIQAKREKEDYDHYYAEHLKEVEAEEKWLQDEANKQKEFEESPEYVQQLIDHESKTTSSDAGTANTGSKEERNTPVGSKTSDAESGSNPKRPSEDNRPAAKGEQQSDKGEQLEGVSSNSNEGDNLNKQKNDNAKNTKELPNDRGGNSKKSNTDVSITPDVSERSEKEQVINSKYEGLTREENDKVNRVNKNEPSKPTLRDFINDKLGVTNSLENLPKDVEKWSDKELKQYPITRAYLEYKKRYGINEANQPANERSTAEVSPTIPTKESVPKEQGNPNTQEVKPKAGDFLRNFADLVEKGKISKLGGFKSSTGFDAVWDSSLTVVAETLRVTGKLADAIEAGLNHIKQTDWYKNLTDKKDFDEKYTAHLEGEYGKFEKESKPEEPKEYTSIKNRIVDEEREQQGKEPLKSSGDGTMAQFEKTKARIESGEIPEEHIRDLTAALATGFDDFSTNLSATEMHHALLYDRNTLQRKSAEIDKGLTEARQKGDKKAEAMWMGKRAQNEILLENNDLAARRLGREWSDVGRARQLLIKQDYTLEALTRKYKAANGGDIPEHVKDKLRKLSKEIDSKDLSIQEMQKKQAEAEKEIEDLKLLIEGEKENRRANMKPEDALADLKKEVKSQVRAQGKRTIEKIKFERENIKASLKNKWKNHVKGGNMGMNNLIPLDMVPDLIKLAKSYIEEGLAVGKEVVLDKIIDRVHRDVVDALENPDIDKTSVRDAITGYGKIKKPNTDPVETAFRDLTAQGRLVSSIELANKGENPLKSGAQRDKPTPEQRRLQKELNKAIKDNNIQVKSPEEQIKTSLDAAKTRLKNQIEDLTDAIDKGEKIVKDRKGIEYDQEANDLKVQRDKLREQYDEIFGTNKELTDEDRIERATKAVQKSIDKLNERIANKDFSQNKKVDLKGPELDALKRQREDLQKVYKDLMDAEGETNRRKLEAMKKHLIKRTAYLNEIKNTGNLDKLLADRVKKKTILDAEALKLRAEQQKVKNDVDNMIAIREFNNMGTLGKAIHWGNRFANGVLISNPAILARILGSVIGRATMKAPTEVVKYGLSKLPFAKGAYTEAIRTRHDLAEHIATYYSTLFSKENFEGMKFAFKHHNTKEDLTLGRNYKKLPIPDAKPGIKNYIQNSFFWTLKALDKNASLHGAGKSLASLPEYRAYQKTIGANLIREGVSPEELGHANLQEAINQLAFRKSLRAKFMQDNFITGLQGSMEEFLRRKGMPNGAELVKGIAPITKISSNYISEALTKMPVVGMVAAYKPIFKIFANALGKDSPLSENEKSVLLRTLTYQGIGALTYMLGYSLHSHFNPFYQSSARKYAQNKEGDEESGWMKLYETLSHFPDALVFNAGVSHGYVWDKYDEENPGEASMYTFMGSLPDALAENARSIGSSSPYLQSASTVINPLVTGKGLGKAAANFIKSRMPFSTTLNELAQGQIPVLNKFGVESGHEEKVKPYEVGIYPKTFMDNIKIGVPGWRQEVLKRLLEEKDAKKPRKTNQEKHDAKVRAHEKKIKEAEFEQQLNE